MPDDAGDVTQARGEPGKPKLKVLRDRLIAEAAGIRTAADWERCLRAVARLPGESFANILLVEAQRPSATMLKSYAEWQAAGRRVNRGEAGIEVFPASRRDNSASRGKPLRAKDATGEQDHPHWRDASHVTHVWDISQTSGPGTALQTPALRLQDEVPPELCDALRWIARREGFAVEHEQGGPADGVTFWTPRRIRLQPGLNASQQAWALAHQLGHVLAHGALPHVPGTTTSGEECTGIRKAEADSVAFITCARYGILVPRYLDPPPDWAGTDPRAQPALTILATGERVVAAATRIMRHLDQAVPGASVGAVRSSARAGIAQHEDAHAGAAAVPTSENNPELDTRQQVLLDEAGAVFSSQLADSWGAAYLSSRGITPVTAVEWHIGYAASGWTGLTSHLLAAGYTENEIEAAGLARRSSRGTLIDQFRDRVVLPVRAADGWIAGFIGRARPDSAPSVPKYLNSPETSRYKKGDLLFGLREAQSALKAGATPVLVEGPFDVIAVSCAGEGHLAGLAPCGTALTQNQAALLASRCNLAKTGVLVAFDDDPAGAKAAIRAYRVLRPFTAILRQPVLAGRDPAQILEQEGPLGLRTVLTAETVPLLSVIIDADLGRWEHRMSETEGPILALRSAAVVLADLLPPAAAAQVRETTSGTELAAVDDHARPVVSPQLPLVARAFPADTASEAVRLASRLGFPADEVVIEIANAVTRQEVRRGSGRSATQASLAASGFPAPPRAGPAPGTPQAHPRTAATRSAHSRCRRR
jgi:DNA primase